MDLVNFTLNKMKLLCYHRAPACFFLVALNAMLTMMIYSQGRVLVSNYARQTAPVIWVACQHAECRGGKATDDVFFNDSSPATYKFSDLDSYLSESADNGFKVSNIHLLASEIPGVVVIKNLVFIKEVGK